MNQIEELQGRIQAALERIGSGARALEAAQAANLEAAQAANIAQVSAQAAEAAASNGAGNAALAQELEEERLANAQLEERLKTLNTRLKEAESQLGPNSDMGALQAELELLRNEAGDPAEKQALRAEVARLKGDIEAAANGAASQREALEDQLTEAQSANAQLQQQLDALATAATGGADGGGSSELEAEVATLRAELDRAQTAVAEAQQQLQAAEAAQAEAARAEQARFAAAEAEAARLQAPDTSAEIDRQNEMLLRLDTELQQLRQANEELRASNAALRDAAAQGLGDAGLINTAMAAEIEGLRAARASDQAQVDAILSKLEPLLAGAGQTPADPMSDDHVPASPLSADPMPEGEAI